MREACLATLGMLGIECTRVPPARTRPMLSAFNIAPSFVKDVIAHEHLTSLMPANKGAPGDAYYASMRQASDALDLSYAGENRRPIILSHQRRGSSASILQREVARALPPCRGSRGKWRDAYRVLAVALDLFARIRELRGP